MMGILVAAMPSRARTLCLAYSDFLPWFLLASLVRGGAVGRSAMSPIGVHRSEAAAEQTVLNNLALKDVPRVAAQFRNLQAE